MRAYKDWKTLQAEAKREKIKDIVQYIMDNTDDPKASDGKGGFAKGYREAVQSFVAKKTTLREKIEHRLVEENLMAVSEAKSARELAKKGRIPLKKIPAKGSDIDFYIDDEKKYGIVTSVSGDVITVQDSSSKKKYKFTVVSD